MGINGIGYFDYRSNMTANKHDANRTERYPHQSYTQERADSVRAGQNAGVQEIYAAFQGKNPYATYVTGEEEVEVSDSDEQKTDTEIIVKADGSKIMMTTVRVGGTETVMSMEIAKAADGPTANPGTVMENPNMMVSDTGDVIEAVSEKL